jgi:large conductance mechanosensitive channel
MGGFKAFLTSSNALALAIGVIIGASLGSVVNTLVNSVIMPPIGYVLGGVDFASIKTVLGTDSTGKEIAIGWGLLINSLIVS